MLFFLMSDLAKIHSYYVYSLAAYTKVFYRGIDLVTDRTTELDDEGNELPVKVVELTDEELAARRRRGVRFLPFLKSIPP